MGLISFMARRQEERYKDRIAQLEAAVEVAGHLVQEAGIEVELFGKYMLEMAVAVDENPGGVQDIWRRGSAELEVVDARLKRLKAKWDQLTGGAE